MRIGIITFHRAVNYGAVLQAYALQKRLQGYGAETHIIDYRCKYLEDNYNPLSILKRSSNLKALIAILIKVFPFAVRKKRNFDIFLKKHLNLSKMYDHMSISRANNDYDIFITGSDQVWNFHHTNFDTNYFLSFVDKKSKKYSYAASFGFENLPENMLDNYKSLLEDFQAISVREQSAQSIVKKILARVIPVVLDPVFLLTKQEWELLASKTRVIKEKYILVYELMSSKTLFDFALKLQAETGYKIVSISNAKHNRKNVISRGTDRPEIFLNYIKNAEYIVTNSFHGTAFSIIFNKQFSVEYLKGSMNSLNTRISDLLNNYGLENRIIGGDDIYNQIIYKSEDNKNKRYINSIEFIKQMLEEHNDTCV